MTWCVQPRTPNERETLSRFSPSMHRWYYLEGMIYECYFVGGLWRISEMELTKTGREWPE